MKLGSLQHRAEISLFWIRDLSVRSETLKLPYFTIQTETRVFWRGLQQIWKSWQEVSNANV